MLLLPQDLPSKGEYSASPPLKYRPFTFLEILEYSNEVTGSAVKDYLRDIQWLQRLDPGILQHSLYDLDYLIFMMKVHTISDSKEFKTDVKCTTCNTLNRFTFDLGDFSFIDVEPRQETVANVLLGGYKYRIKIPTIETFLKVLKLYSLYNKTDKVEVVKLISMFPEFETIPNDIEQAVLNSDRKDISILYMLESKYLSSTNSMKRTCSTCQKEGGMAIGISSLIADMFRDVLLNNPIDESQVQFE
jgi:hypothetical protein